MIGYGNRDIENKIKEQSLPFQPQLPPTVQKFEPEREVYSYYRTQVVPPSSGFPSSISLVPGNAKTTNIRFDIAPCMFNMRTVSLSFQYYPTENNFGEASTNYLIPNSYFPWLKSFKLISQPNSTILFQCDNVDQYSLMHAYVNLNQNKRLRQEGLIVPSQRSKCGYEPYVANGPENVDPFLTIPQQSEALAEVTQIMPDNMNDACQFYFGPNDAAPQQQTINIKFSDLFYDSIFQHEDYLWKYGCYILLEFQGYDQIMWNVNVLAQATINSNLTDPATNPQFEITIDSISLQIDQQQNKYLEQQAEIENSNERLITVPYIYEFNGSTQSNQLIFQLMNQSNYPQKLYKLYASLLYSSSIIENAYLPLTNGNLFQYVSETAISTPGDLMPIEAGYYNEIKLYLENMLFDDIQFDNVNSLAMMMRKLKRQFPDSAHTGIKSLLCNCTIPFKFDDVQNDVELYKSKIAKGIEISHKILPIKIELNTTNPYPAGSYIKAIPVVMRTFKFHNSMWSYV